MREGLFRPMREGLFRANAARNCDRRGRARNCDRRGMIAIGATSFRRMPESRRTRSSSVLDSGMRRNDGVTGQSRPKTQEQRLCRSDIYVRHPYMRPMFFRLQKKGRTCATPTRFLLPATRERLLRRRTGRKGGATPKRGRPYHVFVLLLRHHGQHDVGGVFGSAVQRHVFPKNLLGPVHRVVV